MKTHFVRIAALFVALFSSSLFALPLKQAKLTVSGYQGGETALENFPLLVRISPERISGFNYGDCALDGSDISFALENGEILPHEIDTWKRDGESLVWVKLPALQGTETSFYFRWNDSGPAENISANVWAADYAGVWHMNGASGVTPDSTGHELHAVPKVVPDKGDESKLDTFSIGVPGKVGTARQTATSKTNEGGYLQIPNYDNLALGGTFAMSGWLYQTSHSGQPGLIGRKTAWNSANGWEVEFKTYTTVKARGASGADDTGITIPSSEDKWIHLAFVYNNTACIIYTNGYKQASRTIATPTDNGLPLFLGRRGAEGVTASYIRGYFDEFRLKDGVPSAEWIKAEYDSMVSDNFITYAAAEDIALGNVLIISGEPSRIGSPDPAYGTVDSLDPQESLTLSQPSLEVPGEGTVTNYLKGWTLEKIDVVSGEKTLLRSSSDAGEGEAINVCKYVHNSLAVMTWLWDVRDQLGARDFALVENGGNYLKFSVDVTGIGYTASSVKVKLLYGITPDNFIWTHVANEAVEKGGVLEMTLPNTIPGVYYYVKAVLETNEAEPQVVETEVIKIQADPSVAGEGSSPLENVVLDASLGNKLTVKGTLTLASGGTLTVLVGDSLETITNAWTQLDGSSLSSAEEFSLTLGDAEPGSSRYLAPGSKYYVLVMVETGDGEIFISPVQSVTTPPSTSWTYYETATKNGIGSGYITDGVWKLSANRGEKNSSNLYASASDGAFYGVKSCVYPINLTVIHSEDKSEVFTVTRFGRISYKSDVKNHLYNSKERLSEFIAPDCVSLEGGQDNGYNFSGCTSLTNVVLNVGLAEFPAQAFSGCSNLAKLSPLTFTSCQKLYGSAFSGCSKLVGKFDFPVCVSVANEVFSSCRLIEEVSIPAATSIGNDAFKNCASLAKVVVSKNLIQIGRFAFYGCVNLEPDFLQSILTKSIQHIGPTDVTKKGSEFYGCTSLKTLVWNLPNLATNIVTSSCFEGCTSLEKVVFKTPVYVIRSKAFYGIKPGAEIYMHQEVPALIERETLSRYKEPYTKVYLSGNVDGWLEVLGRYHHVIPKDKFDDRTFYAEASSENWTCGRTTEHRKQSWQTMVNAMAKDTAVCESVKSGSNVTSVKMKERGVIAFVLCHNGNHGESCFWVMRAPQTGFSVRVR